MSASSGLLRQVALLPAGGQPWFKNVLACKGRRFAYAATLAVYVYQVLLVVWPREKVNWLFKACCHYSLKLGCLLEWRGIRDKRNSQLDSTQSRVRLSKDWNLKPQWIMLMFPNVRMKFSRGIYLSVNLTWFSSFTLPLKDSNRERERERATGPSLVFLLLYTIQ